MSDPRRNLPGVDTLLASEGFEDLLTGHPRARVIRATREVLDGVRGSMGPEGGIPSQEGFARRVEALLLEWGKPSLRRVINATGVVLHTNMGRAPLSDSARKAMASAGQGYSNLEFDLAKGERGSRYVHCVDLLKEITGAEDALVVNNNAAAVVLVLNALAQGREVLISRGELVEIGGGFRIPDMISRSGAILREVGTTNRTRIADYREAAGDGRAAAILKVHRSNFRISGFTEEADIKELGELAREEGLVLFHDLGSGLLADPSSLGLPVEPRAHESLGDGSHVVAISGDKLLGGPQAGIILGEKEVVERLRRNPLTRAFRVDKVTLAGLEATLRHYLEPEEAIQQIPALKMLALGPEDLEERTRALASGLEALGVQARVEEGKGVVGGGTYPGVGLPGWILRIGVPGLSSRELARCLRLRDLPIVGRQDDQDLIVDLRTVDTIDDGVVSAALHEIFLAHQAGSADGHGAEGKARAP